MYELNYAAVTHPGKVRANNEDNFYIRFFYKEDVDQTEAVVQGSVRNGKLTASVCDGMGGQDLGEQASLYAVETLAELTRRDHSLFRDDPMEYVNLANDRICAEIRRRNMRMGTTLTVLEFLGDRVLAVNLGDTRIYRFRGGALRQLSVDHSIVGQMIRMGQITPEEARVHPKRHQITQHLGIFPEEMILEPAVSPELEIAEDDLYLLCSDGLTDTQTDEEIAGALGGGGTPLELCYTLLERALDRGGRDNVTVMLIKVGAPVKWWKIF